MSFFISSAMAATDAAVAPAQNGAFSFVMMFVIFGLFYVMLIRPQSKRAKAHRALIEQVKKGDEVVTSAGILGKITEIDDQYIKLAIAEGIVVTMQRSAINLVLPKGSLKSL